jgi:hypothetical protein
MSLSISNALEAAQLLQRQVHGDHVNAEACHDLLQTISATLDNCHADRDLVQKSLLNTQRAFRARARNKSDTRTNEQWKSLAKKVTTILQAMRQPTTEAVRIPPTTLNLTTSTNTRNVAVATKATSVKTCDRDLPSSRDEYLARLKLQKKELYKNPPILPPAPIMIESEWVQNPPTRNAHGELQFTTGHDAQFSNALALFRPNLSPEQILRGGAFGGTYFRSIDSAVLNRHIAGAHAIATTLPPEWILGLDVDLHLTSPTYHAHVNKYKVKCGGSLGMWESSGVSM